MRRSLAGLRSYLYFLKSTANFEDWLRSCRIEKIPSSSSLYSVVFVQCQRKMIMSRCVDVNSNHFLSRHQDISHSTRQDLIRSHFWNIKPNLPFHHLLLLYNIRCHHALVVCGRRRWRKEMKTLYHSTKAIRKLNSSFIVFAITDNSWNFFRSI